MKNKSKYNFDSEIYTPSDVKEVLHLATCENDLVGNNKGVYYYNIPCAFDIETTSFYRDLDGKTYSTAQYNQLDKKDRQIEKLGIMYIWQFGINGYTIVGRTWSEFLEMVQTISETLHLTDEKRLLVYVHNLAFEFQFMCKMFQWENVFSLDMRKPLYALTNCGIEFRCSYLLSGYALETVAKNLQRYSVPKLVGYLDYELVRHEKTVITDKEMQYCVNDIKIVMLYIKEYIENVKNVHNIPLTKTGAVRKFCRKNCFFIPKTDTEKTKINYEYKDLMHDLQINNLNEFKMLQRAFCGGFTHANSRYVDEIVKDVTSFDFTSSYPYVMISEKFPMSKGVKINVKSRKQFETMMQMYHCVFDIEFTNIISISANENYISVSKCIETENAAENNGRLVSASRIVTTITNIDFNIIKNFYSWDSYKVGYMYCYRRDYLPTEFVKSIIDLYKKKTELKGVDGMEREYLSSKEMLNSCYGMCVTNPIREEITYTDNWQVKELTDSDREEMIYSHNISKSRFLYYIWGVFVTAFARKNLFTAIRELGNDYVYSDTDSVKFINYDKHKNYFAAYNYSVEMKLKTACKFHGLPFSDCKPKTIKGKEKLLGVWDYEGTYTRFKTLGAKRYMVEKENALTVGGKTYNFSLTVSGVNKQYAIPYLLETYGENGIFEHFTNYLYIPPDASGKNIITYIDYETEGDITDYNGVTCHFVSKSGAHFEKSDYTMNLSVLFLQHLLGIKQITKE